MLYKWQKRSHWGGVLASLWEFLARTTITQWFLYKNYRRSLPFSGTKPRYNDIVNLQINLLLDDIKLYHEWDDNLNKRIQQYWWALEQQEPSETLIRSLNLAPDQSRSVASVVVDKNSVRVPSMNNHAHQMVKEQVKHMREDIYMQKRCVLCNRQKP